MWRQTDDRKVWYEWVVEVFKIEEVRIPMAGPNAPRSFADNMSQPDYPVGKDGEQMRTGMREKRVKVGMSDLHSSRANGCLM